MTGGERVVDELLGHEQVVASDGSHLERPLAEVLANALVDLGCRSVLDEPVVEVVLDRGVERERRALHVEQPQLCETHERLLERRAIQLSERRPQSREDLAETLRRGLEEHVVEHVRRGPRAERGEPLEDRGLRRWELLREPLEDDAEACALAESRFRSARASRDPRPRTSRGSSRARTP
jgi:hypothetical protein